MLRKIMFGILIFMLSVFLNCAFVILFKFVLRISLNKYFY